MSSWHSYPSIFNLGHKAIKDLLNGTVNVEEKVDGSQFSFGIFPDTDTPTVRIIDDVEYGLKVRSKGAVMHPEAPQAMFKAAVSAVKDRVDLLHPNWTYRGEVLAKSKHNALAYDRVPQSNVIIFDINSGEEEYLSYEEKRKEATRIGFECVPLLYSGMVESVDQFRRFLDTTSVLGGQKIEGVVVKPINYDLFGQDKKVLLGKFVSEAFKEVHRKAWGESNPSKGDIIEKLISAYATPARWNKAIQHLKEAGQLEDSPRDIGKLIKEIPEDVFRECEEEILDVVWKWAKDHVRRGLTRGFPEYYKQRLLEMQFEKEEFDPALELRTALQLMEAEEYDKVSPCPDDDVPDYDWNFDPRVDPIESVKAYQEVEGISTIRTEADALKDKDVDDEILSGVKGG